MNANQNLKARSTDIPTTYLRIRKIIGILGFLLPIVVFIFNDFDLLPSMSHYYYTKSSIFFTSILFTFGLFLISYKGRNKCEDESLSDNLITHIAGLAVLIVVFFPTSCKDSFDPEIIKLCTDCDFRLFGHNTPWKDIVHLVSAGIFLALMGWMSYFRFTKKDDHQIEEEIYTKTYKYCAYIIWFCVGLLIIKFATELKISIYDVLILETIALFAFAYSWTVKGQALKDIQKLFNKT